MEDINAGSDFIRHLPCENCGSSDANSLYTDGHTFCFSCNTYRHSDNDDKGDLPLSTEKSEYNFVAGDIKSLIKRKLTLETCQKFNYQVGTLNGKSVQIANYYNKKRKLVFQKLRFPNKEFSTIGNIEQATLYGQHLWKSKGKIVCVCEGEVDTMSLSQLFNHRYPVVGIPNGVNGAVKALKKQLEYLESFESIVLMYDQDKQGQDCANECAELFTIGKCKIANWELKDVNDMLIADRGEEIIKAMWEARPWRPDGIVGGTELWELVKEPTERAVAMYPYEGLNKKLYGLRKREIVTVTGGSGIGKSLLVKEITYKLIKDGFRIGIISLEESLKRTCEGIIGIHLNKPIHIEKEGIDEGSLKTAFEATVGNGNVFLYDHWGSISEETILNKIKYFSKALDIDFLVIDHISIIVSGLETYDERKTIDVLMTKLRSLVEQLNIGCVIISHLKRPEGNKDHTDGLQTSLGQLRGSSSIGQISDIVIGVERSTSDVQEEAKTTLRILKNRFAGITGVAAYLKYSNEKNRLLENDTINF